MLFKKKRHDFKRIACSDYEKDEAFVTELCSYVSMLCRKLKLNDLMIRITETNTDTQEISWEADVAIQVGEEFGDTARNAVKYRQSYKAENRENPDKNYNGAFTVAFSSPESVVSFEHELLVRLIYAEYYRSISKVYCGWITYYKDSPINIW